MQLPFDIPFDAGSGAYDYGTRSDGGTHGLVLTKPHVVEMILDLSGYRPEADLAHRSLLEPACGEGAFLVPAARRLLASARAHGTPAASLEDALAAFDIEEAHVRRTREALLAVLREHDVGETLAHRLSERWVARDDFLLARNGRVYDHIVGNPPYVRIEQISPRLQAEYRRRFPTLFDRADLYVAFIERALGLLSPTGMLAYICADRWTLNRYGAPLRKLISSSFEVRTYVDLHEASPFESDVIAYPAIFVVSRERTGAPVAAIAMPTASPRECDRVRSLVAGRRGGDAGDGAGCEPVTVACHARWFQGDEPWVPASPDNLALLRRLEAAFPLLEDDGGTSVRIGVATGNDRLYVVKGDADIEPQRLVPLVMREDIDGGVIRDGGRFVVNTFDAGGLVDLAHFPRLSRYLESHRAELSKRHVAKAKHAWFRTIDRVYPEFVPRPKLLIPDIAGANEVVFEPGRYHPHHNLYFVVSDIWDMEVLGALLSSKVALFFVWSYAVRMRGGYLRFQAQYLRRIRVPKPEQISAELAASLRQAFRRRDFQQIDRLASGAYGLDSIPEFDFVDTRR